MAAGFGEEAEVGDCGGQTHGKKGKAEWDILPFPLRPVAGSLLYSSLSQNTSGTAVLAGSTQLLRSFPWQILGNRFVENFWSLIEGLYSMYLYINFKIRNVDLEMLWNKIDISEREIELEKSFKICFCK